MESEHSGDICFEVDAALVNLNKARFISKTFVLPSEAPEVDLSLYKFERDEDLDLYYIYRSVRPTRNYNTYYISPPAESPAVGTTMVDEEENEVSSTTEENDGEMSQLVAALDIQYPGTLSKPTYISQWLDLAASEIQQESLMTEPDEKDEGHQGNEGERGSDISVVKLEQIAEKYEIVSKSHDDKPLLRHFIPEDVQSEVNAYYYALPPERQNLQGWIFATNVIDWKYMAFFSKQLRLLGLYKHVPLQQADSFDVWQSKSTVPAQTSTSSSGMESNDARPETCIPPHHINFLSQPVFQKSDTPPEVSLWAAVISERFPAFEPLSRRGVIASQATKLIDPFLFRGQQSVLELSGTELRNSVTGYVDKVYLPVGTWTEDEYDEDDEKPKTTEEVPDEYWNNRDYGFQQMQKPYLMQPDDCDIIINDNASLHPPCPRRSIDGQPYAGHGPSKLSQMHTSDELVLDEALENLDEEKVIIMASIAAKNQDKSEKHKMNPDLTDDANPNSSPNDVDTESQRDEIHTRQNQPQTDFPLQKDPTENAASAPIHTQATASRDEYPPLHPPPLHEQAKIEHPEPSPFHPVGYELTVTKSTAGHPTSRPLPRNSHTPNNQPHPIDPIPTITSALINSPITHPTISPEQPAKQADSCEGHVLLIDTPPTRRRSPQGGAQKMGWWGVMEGVWALAGVGVEFFLGI